MTPKTQKTDRPSWMGQPTLTAADRDAARTAAATATNSQANRRQAVLDGLSRFVRRFERAGQKSAAKKIASLHTKATALLAERDKAEAEAMATRPDPLAVAFDDAARELRKVLPTCFPSDADALAFARRLPMRDALKVANDLLNERRARLKEVKRIECRFWEAATDAGRLAFGDADDDANLRKLAAAGL